MAAQPRPRRPRWLLGSMGLLAFLGLLFLGFDHLVEIELKPLIVRGLEKVSQGPVSLSSVRGNLFGEIVLRDLVLDLPGSAWQTHLKASQVEVNLDLLNLLFKKKALENCVRSLRIIKPQVTLIRIQSSIPETGHTVPVSGLLSIQHFTIPVFLVPAPRLYVKEGSLSVNAGKETQNQLTGVDFEAFSNDANDWSLVFSAQPADSSAGGSLRFTGSLHLDHLKVSGKAQLTDWPLVQAGAILQDLAGWKLNGGRVDAECPLVFQPERGFWFDSRVNLHGASLVSPKPLAATFEQINGRISVRSNEIEIPGDLTFSTSGTIWSAHGLWPWDGRPIQIKATTEDLLLSSLSSGLLKLKGPPWEGKGKASLLVNGTYQNPILTGEANLESSKIGEIILDGFKAQGRYEAGNLTLTHLEGNLYDGTFSAQGQIGLTGQADAPLSITAELKNLDTGKLFLSYGLREFFGIAKAQVQLSGTIQNPIVSALNQTDFNATETHDAYSMQNIFKWEDGVITLNSKINGQEHMKTEVHETTDGWQVLQTELTFADGTGLTGTGFFPKDLDKPMDFSFKNINGKKIKLELIPLFHERFNDVKGLVEINIHNFGTRHNPEGSIQINGQNVIITRVNPISAELQTSHPIKIVKPQSYPLFVDLYYNRESWFIKDLEYGPIFSAHGHYGREDDSQDLTFNAQKFPLSTVAELSGWSNPAQPFEGLLTGRLHVSGLKNNPVVEGDAVVSGFKLGDWWADQLEASMNRDQGKLLIRKFKLTQGANSFIASGAWDTNTQPGQMNLRLFAKNFQFGHGPFLNGNFSWTAQTMEPWFKNWTGRFSTEGFSLGNGKTNQYSFTRFTLDAVSRDLVLDGKFQLGDSMEGRANIDLSHLVPSFSGSINISPTLISKMPELTQFIPNNMNVNGTLSGKLHFGPGTWEILPLVGDLQIADGIIAKKFTFENLSLTFSGDRTHIEPIFKLGNKKSTYQLTGSLDSPKGFWAPDCKVVLEGPFSDSLDRLLLFFPDLDPSKHRTAGSLKGNLTLGGTWAKLNFNFSMAGENLQFDDNQVVSGELHCGYSDGRMFLDNSRLTLPKGEINIERGSLFFDPADSSHLSLSLAGSSQNLSISLFNLTSKINVTGDLFLNESSEKPTFSGSLSILDSNPTSSKSNPFELNLRVKHHVIELLAFKAPRPQLVGILDLSQPDKIIFQQIKLLNAPAAFSVDGTLDLKGESHLTSDAKDIPIHDVAKWLLPDFPLTGIANYHMVFDGPIAHPIMTSSLTVNGGQIGQLKFDLFTAELKSKNDILFLGDVDSPIEISRSGLYDFTLYGNLPLALTDSTRISAKNQEMDIHAKMERGDFSILLAAGLAKEAKGAMYFDAHVTGTLDNPYLSTLDLGLSSCRMVPFMIAQSLDDINGRIKVRDNKLAVEDLNFQVGQGRVFITSPPIEKSKMILDNFIPQYLDFMVRTVGEHGLWLNVPTIMHKGEWGEIYFYGQTPDDPLLITGSINEPHVIGTALLDTGHYTFPPEEARDEHGEKIEYRELANVFFELNLLSGKNTWYSNDSNTNYLELKVDPGDVITIEGKDSNRTAEEAGIQCHGTAGSSKGTLRYLSHEFQLQDARLEIPKGKLPMLEGHASDKFLNVELMTPGGSVEHTDMDVFVNFKGTFGDINFDLDSNPRFSSNDKDIQQKVLLSYVIFGRDMTGYSGQAYSSQQLQQLYQQNIGQAAGSAVVDALNRVGTNYITAQIRPFISNWIGADVQIKGNPIGGGSGSNSGPISGTQSIEPAGNTLAGSALPLLQVVITKPIDPRLSIETVMGTGRDIYSNAVEWQGRFGLNYSLTPKLTLSLSEGQNDVNQTETRGEIKFKTDLPDMISPKPGDKEKPRFERSDYYPMGKGKYHFVWELDKTNKSEVRIFDSTGTMIRVIPDKSDWNYKHELDVENLSENQDYKILISAKDPNGNEAISILKIPAISE